MSCNCGNNGSCDSTLVYLNGIEGPQGPTGVQGPTGATGPVGATGLQGPAGLNGANGVNGLNGVDGQPGLPGARGPAGADGAPGSVGPSPVYRGYYNPTTNYYYNSKRVDIVAYLGAYYLTNNASKDGNNTWGVPTGTDWQTFGATFSSVATGILLAEDAIVTVSLTLGQDGPSALGKFKSANYAAGVSGFYMDYTGFAEFGDVKIRGTIDSSLLSNDSEIFNPSKITSTFPASSVFNTFIGNGHSINGQEYMTVGQIFGWEAKSGFNKDVYGQSTTVFQGFINTAWTITDRGPGFSHADTSMVYRIVQGNGSQGAWQAFVPSIRVVETPNQMVSVGVAEIGSLPATGYVEFAILASTPAAQDYMWTYVGISWSNI